MLGTYCILVVCAWIVFVSMTWVNYTTYQVKPEHHKNQVNDQHKCVVADDGCRHPIDKIKTYVQAQHTHVRVPHIRLKVLTPWLPVNYSFVDVFPT